MASAGGGGVRIVGLAEAEAKLKALADATRTAGETTASVGTAAPYAWGIHFGRHRDGRLARRAGGTHFLTDPLERLLPAHTSRLAQALPKGAAAVSAVVRATAFALEALAKPLIPVRSGNLRGSLQTKVDTGGRGGGGNLRAAFRTAPER